MKRITDGFIVFKEGISILGSTKVRITYALSRITIKVRQYHICVFPPFVLWITMVAAGVRVYTDVSIVTLHKRVVVIVPYYIVNSLHLLHCSH